MEDVQKALTQALQMVIRPFVEEAFREAFRGEFQNHANGAWFEERVKDLLDTYAPDASGNEGLSEDDVSDAVTNWMDERFVDRLEEGLTQLHDNGDLHVRLGTDSYIEEYLQNNLKQAIDEAISGYTLKDKIDEYMEEHLDDVVKEALSSICLSDYMETDSMIETWMDNNFERFYDAAKETDDGPNTLATKVEALEAQVAHLTSILKAFGNLIVDPPQPPSKPKDAPKNNPADRFRNIVKAARNFGATSNLEGDE